MFEPGEPARNLFSLATGAVKLTELFWSQWPAADPFGSTESRCADLSGQQSFHANRIDLECHADDNPPIEPSLAGC
jgi:hypothetical protein